MRLDQLLRIAPKLEESRAKAMLPHLVAAMEEAEINTVSRAAAFLAQLAHESDGFRAFEEYASGIAYEGRASLGNVKPGDGIRYKGRGPIQLTGRANYRMAGMALGVDLENHPELASSFEVGFRVAAWYWTRHGLNELADKGHFRSITKKINGPKCNGLEQRYRLYATAIVALDRLV